jgi:hypothetical protein
MKKKSLIAMIGWELLPRNSLFGGNAPSIIDSVFINASVYLSAMQSETQKAFMNVFHQLKGDLTQ